MATCSMMLSSLGWVQSRCTWGPASLILWTRTEAPGYWALIAVSRISCGSSLQVSGNRVKDISVLTKPPIHPRRTVVTQRLKQRNKKTLFSADVSARVQVSALQTHLEFLTAASET